MVLYRSNPKSIIVINTLSVVVLADVVGNAVLAEDLVGTFFLTAHEVAFGLWAAVGEVVNPAAFAKATDGGSMAAELHGGVVLVPLLLGSDVEADGHGMAFGANLNDAQGVTVGIIGLAFLVEELPCGIETVGAFVLADGDDVIVGGAEFARCGVVAGGAREGREHDYQIFPHKMQDGFECKDTKKN